MTGLHLTRDCVPSGVTPSLSNTVRASFPEEKRTCAVLGCDINSFMKRKEHAQC